MFEARPAPWLTVCVIEGCLDGKFTHYLYTTCALARRRSGSDFSQKSSNTVVHRDFVQVLPRICTFKLESKLNFLRLPLFKNVEQSSKITHWREIIHSWVLRSKSGQMYVAITGNAIWNLDQPRWSPSLLLKGGQRPRSTTQTVTHSRILVDKCISTNLRRGRLAILILSFSENFISASSIPWSYNGSSQA